MKSQAEQDKEFENLNKNQQDSYELLRENGCGHTMAMKLCYRYTFYDIEHTMVTRAKMNIGIDQAFMFEMWVSALTEKQRKLYHQINDKFCVDPGDEYLALQMVKDYDTENLQEIVNEHDKGSLTIDIFAMEQVKGRCRFPIIDVEAELTETVPDIPF